MKCKRAYTEQIVLHLNKFFDSKKKKQSVDLLEAKCEFSFLECARQIFMLFM